MLELRQVLKEDDPAVATAKELGRFFPAATAAAAPLLDGTNTQRQSEYHGKVDPVIAALRKVEQDEIYLALGSLRDRLAAHTNTAGESIWRDLLSHIEPLLKALNKYFHEQNHGNAFLVSRAAFNLSQAITAARTFASLTADQVEPRVDVAPGYGMLELLLPGFADFNAIIEKLQALEELYRELCDLLDITPSDYPLAFLELEAGSLLAKVIGAEKSLDILGKLILGVARYIHRNWTSDGRLDAVRREAETVKAVRSVLREFEIDGAKLDEAKLDLERSLLILARKTRVLLEDQPEVRVNGVVEIVLREPPQSRRLSRGPRLLESGAENITHEDASDKSENSD